MEYIPSCQNEHFKMLTVTMYKFFLVEDIEGLGSFVSLMLSLGYHFCALEKAFWLAQKFQLHVFVWVNMAMLPVKPIILSRSGGVSMS